jgi:hypothetical protein
MPSEALAQAALQAVRARADAFRSAVAVTAEQLRSMLDTQRHGATTTDRSSAALGAFATGRINADRLAQALAPVGPTDAARSPALERALVVLEEIERRGDDLFCLRVERGEDLHAAVEVALADAGRVFLAARIASKNGPDVDEGQLSAGFPFRRWSRAERHLAPPLVIEVDGGDLAAAGLASYLDGDACFVILVSGQAPPAALARLIAPGVLVVQADDAEALQLLSGFGGPAAIAVVASESARFVHRPTGDGGMGTIEVTHVPLQAPRRPIGSISVFQQEQDVRLLNKLAIQPQPPPATTAPASAGVATNGTDVAAQAAGHSNGKHQAGDAPAVDPVATLAAWLLSRVDLSDLESGGG